MNETLKAYAAGLVDGEGTIAVEGGKGRHLSIRVYLSSSTPVLLKAIKNEWGGCINLNNRRRPIHWSPVYKLHLQNRLAYQFLKDVLPYLRLKNPQAVLALHFQESTVSPRNRRPLPKEVLELRTKIKETIHLLNHDPDRLLL
jgi:hypothetical protein